MEWAGMGMNQDNNVMVWFPNDKPSWTTKWTGSLYEVGDAAESWCHFGALDVCVLWFGVLETLNMKGIPWKTLLYLPSKFGDNLIYRFWVTVPQRRCPHKSAFWGYDRCRARKHKGNLLVLPRLENSSPTLLWNCFVALKFGKHFDWA